LLDVLEEDLAEELPAIAGATTTFTIVVAGAVVAVAETPPLVVVVALIVVVGAEVVVGADVVVGAEVVVVTLMVVVVSSSPEIVVVDRSPSRVVVGTTQPLVLTTESQGVADAKLAPTTPALIPTVTTVPAIKLLRKRRSIIFYLSTVSGGAPREQSP
jgi:hypothetical protein